MEIRSFASADTESVIALWRACELVRPWNDPRRDIERKLEVEPELLLVGVLDGRIVGTVMAGYEGHRGWLNYLAVDPDHRGRGYGRLLVHSAEERLASRGCPKVNLQVRTENAAAIGFYQHLGYRVDDVVSMGRRLVEDGPGASHREPGQ